MDIILNLFFNDGFILAKIFVLLLLALYVGFAFVLNQQQRLMTSTIEAPISSFFHLMSLIHLFAAISLFIISIFLL